MSTDMKKKKKRKERVSIKNGFPVAVKSSGLR